MADSKLPETLGWYRDAGNWIVGLSTGALAAAITQADRIRITGRGAQTVFLVAALLFLVAIVAGIQFYLWLTSYGNARERQTRRGEEIKDQTVRDGDGEYIAATSEMSRAEKKFGYFHDVMIWAFHLGALAFAIVAVWLFVASPRAPREWTVVPAPCDSPAGCGHRRSYVLKVERHTGATWYLRGDSARTLQWSPVPDDSSGRAGARDSASAAMRTGASDSLSSERQP